VKSELLLVLAEFRHEVSFRWGESSSQLGTHKSP